MLAANLVDIGQLLRDSYVALLFFIAIMALATLYLSSVYPHPVPPLDALYESFRLLIFQSSLTLPHDPLGVVIFFLLPVVGVLAIVQSVLNFGRGFFDKDSRLQDWQRSLAATYRDHVVVCGLGRVGLRVITRLLEAGYDAVVIEQDWNSEFVHQALALKVPVVQGDAREAHTLRQAGAGRARAVIASIDGDLVNIEIALAARKIFEQPSLSPKPRRHIILRAFNDGLDRRLESTFGKDSAFSASGLAEPTLTAATISRDLDYALPLDDDGALIGVAQIKAQRGSPLCDTVSAVERRFGVRALPARPLSLRRAQTWRRHTIREGETTAFLGGLGALEALRVSADSALTGPNAPLQHPVPGHDRVIICGLGKVGYRVVKRLYKLSPRPTIVVIYTGDTTTAFYREVSQLDGVTIVTGDASDPDQLKAAGIEYAYSVAALTSDDTVNLQIGLAARELASDVHVVLRVFSDTLAGQLEGLFGIRTAYSTSDLASPTLAASGVAGGVDRAFSLNGMLLASQTLTVSPRDLFDGQTVERVRDARGVTVVGLRRGGRLALLPALDQTLAPGDEIVALGALRALTQVRGR